MALRILVADDHEVVRRGLCALLEAHAGWQICGEAADGRAAVAKTKELNPDILVMDIGMPSLNDLAAAEQIMQANPRQRILILTITRSEQVRVGHCHCSCTKPRHRAVSSAVLNGQVLTGGNRDGPGQ